MTRSPRSPRSSTRPAALHLRGHGEVALHLDVSLRPPWPAGRSPSYGSSRSRARSGRTAACVRSRDAVSASRRTAPPPLERSARGGIVGRGGVPLSRPPRRVVGRRCCRAAYVRGAFLGAGSVSGPRRPHSSRCGSPMSSGAAFLAGTAAQEDVELHIRAEVAPTASRTPGARRRLRTRSRSRAQAMLRSRSTSTRSSERRGQRRTGSRTPTTRTSSEPRGPRTASCVRCARLRRAASSRSSPTRCRRSRRYAAGIPRASYSRARRRNAIRVPARPPSSAGSRGSWSWPAIDSKRERGGPKSRTRVGINGFGRIGRNFLRAHFERGGDFEIVAVNDIGDTSTMAHLLKYDSVLGPVREAVETAEDGSIPSTASESEAHRPRPDGAALGESSASTSRSSRRACSRSVRRQRRT